MTEPTEIIIPENKKDTIQSQKVLPRKQNHRIYLNPEIYYERLAQMPNTKDKILVQFLWFTGCRITEVLNIRKRDIDFQRNEILIRWLKSRKWNDRVIPVKKELMSILAVYCMTLNLDDYLFSIDRFHAYKIVKRWLKVSPHKLRHSFAVNFMRQTQDHATLKKLLGHKNVNTTLMYSELAPVEQAKVLEGVKM